MIKAKKYNTFKSLKKQQMIYDYCEKRIKKGEVFTIKDIANDLQIARSSAIEHLQEISKKFNNFSYDKGNIYIIGVGTNGIKGNEGLVVKKMNKTTKSRIEKKKKVYDYLVGLAKEDKNIPCLSRLHDVFNDMHVSNLAYVLQSLHDDNKIIYKRGKIIAVNIPSVKSTTGKEIKYVKQQEDTVEPQVVETVEPVETQEPESEVIEPITNNIGIDDFDKNVKDLIADYILNADITTKEDIISYVNAIMNITDKLKKKLFEEVQ